MPHALPTMVILLLGWLGCGVLGFLLPPRLWRRLLFPLLALSAAILAVRLSCWEGGVETLVLPAGIPGLALHFRLDPLAAFFLVLLGWVAVGVALYATGYFAAMSRDQPATFRRVAVGYPGFMAAMGWVILADDAYTFMVAWEFMALTSWFLVVLDHDIDEIRQAGYLYLLMAHLGALTLVAAFALLAQGGDVAFESMRHAHLSSTRTNLVFLLALAGFGAKAGILPLHAWLPEAHPAAPSPVSALMSGVMLKVALYGMMRLSLDLVGVPQGWWGALLVILGSLSALFGVLFAAVQFDIKRLLAWSSVENLGLMFSGLGLVLLFHGAGQESVAALALAGVLYHALNHGMFKSLLFLCSGSVLHATTERNMAKLGGLIRAMPWVSALALVGVLSLAGLPPFNGFVSEWLMLQAYLLRPHFPQAWLDMTLPLGAAVLALVGALAGYAMVKFYGIVFLGRPRGLDLSQVHDAGVWEKLGLLGLTLGCMGLGLFPSQVITRLDIVTHALVGQGLAASAAHHGWLWLTPMSAQRASYSPVILLVLILFGLGMTVLVVRLGFHGRWRRAPAWDCGFPAQNWRMQDSADGFGQPIKQMFEGFLGLTRETPSAFDPAPYYRSRLHDPIRVALYQPLLRAVEALSRLLERTQQVRIATYLLYSFVTLLSLLALVSWGLT